MLARIFRRVRTAAVLVTGVLLLIQTSAARADAGQIQKLIAEGDLTAALALAERELEADAENLTYRFLKGLILTRQDRLEQARDVFLGITRSNPELPEPYNNLAVVYAALGDFDRARQALEKAINTHPAYATAHENIGDIYAKLASQAYNQALELDTSNNSARAKLSLVNELFSLPEASSPVTLASAETAQPVEPEFRKTPVRPQPGDAVEEQASPPVPEPGRIERQAVTRAGAASPPAEAAGPAAGGQAEAQRPQAQAGREQAARAAAVKQAVMDWSAAWSAQDVEAYLSYYADDFTPDDGISLEAWRAQRRNRVSSPASIQVFISDLVVEMLGQDHTQAIFTQLYQSDVYSDRVKKTLLFKREDGRWLITQEDTK